MKSIIDSGKKAYYREEFRNKKYDLPASWRIVHNMLFNVNDKKLQDSDKRTEILAKAEKFNDFFFQCRKKDL